MSTLHVLLPPLAPFADVRGWRQWLVRGDRLPEVADARNTMLRELLRFPGDQLPVAALRHYCHADRADRNAWLCADPAWVRSEATGARLMAWPLIDVTVDEARALAASVQPLLGDAGMPLAIDAANEWCIRLADGAQLPAFVAPQSALGAALLDCLPPGDAGRAWRRLFSEVQIVLHAHSVNAARIAAGQHPVNALWFWGAGALPHAVATDVRVIATHDDALRGLAKVAHAACIEPVPDGLQAAGEGDALLDLAVASAGQDFDAWLAAFRQALRTHRFATIELTFASGERVRIRHRHRFRFWRHP